MIDKMKEWWEDREDREKMIISVGLTLFVVVSTVVWGWVIHLGIQETEEKLENAKEQLDERRSKTLSLAQYRGEYSSLQEEWEVERLQLWRDADRGSLLQEMEKIVESMGASLETLDLVEEAGGEGGIEQDTEMVEVKSFDLSIRADTASTMDILRLLEDTRNPSRINQFQMEEEEREEYLELEEKEEELLNKKEALRGRKDGYLRDVKNLREQLRYYKMGLLFEDLEKQQLNFSDLQRLRQLEEYGIIEGIDPQELKKWEEYREEALLEEAREELSLVEITEMSQEQLREALEEREILTLQHRVELEDMEKEMEELDKDFREDREEIKRDIKEYKRVILLEEISQETGLQVGIEQVYGLEELKEYGLIARVNTDNLVELEDFDKEDKDKIEDFKEELCIQELWSMDAGELRRELEDREALTHSHRMDIMDIYEEKELLEESYRQGIERLENDIRNYKMRLLFEYRDKGFGLGMEDLERLETLKEYGIIEKIHVDKLELFEDRERGPGEIVDVDRLSLEEIRKMTTAEIKNKLEERGALEVENVMDIEDYHQELFDLEREIGKLREELAKTDKDLNRVKENKRQQPAGELQVYLNIDFYSLSDAGYQEILEGEAGRRDPFREVRLEDPAEVFTRSELIDRRPAQVRAVDELLQEMEIIQDYGVAEGEFYPYTRFAHEGTVNSLMPGEVARIEENPASEAANGEEGARGRSSLEVEYNDITLRYEVDEVLVEEGEEVDYGDELAVARGDFKVKGSRLNRTFHVLTTLAPGLSGYTDRKESLIDYDIYREITEEPKHPSGREREIK